MEVRSRRHYWLAGFLSIQKGRYVCTLSYRKACRRTFFRYKGRYDTVEHAEERSSGMSVYYPPNLASVSGSFRLECI